MNCEAVTVIPNTFLNILKNCKYTIYKAYCVWYYIRNKAFITK